MSAPGTTFFQECLDRLRSGDPDALETLLVRSQERLKLLTRRMLRKFPGVRRWEETDDVFQRVLMRLERTLRALPVTTVIDYVRLASRHIRHVLIDLARHYYGPRGAGANHATPPVGTAGHLLPAGAEPVSPDGPLDDLDWAEWHEQIENLPPDQREVFDLIWYHGASQQEAAGILGVSLSTVQRRWQAARICLAASFAGEAPA